MSKKLTLDSNIFVASDGVKIHYLATPLTKSQNTLLFIHGIGHDATTWRDVQEMLFEKGYPSISIDLRGHGLSDDPVDSEAYEFNRLTKDIVELVEKLELPHVVLIGHSLGGMVSMYLAGTSKLPLSGLILIETNYRLTSNDLPEKFSQNLSHALRSLAYLFPNGRPKNHTNYSKYADTKDFDFVRIADDIRITSLRSYLLTSSHIASFDATHLLSSIKVPTLVVAGENDSIISPETAIDLTNRIPEAEFAIIPDVNHIVTIADPENLARIIDKFVGKLQK